MYIFKLYTWSSPQETCVFFIFVSSTCFTIFDIPVHNPLQNTPVKILWLILLSYFICFGNIERRFALWLVLWCTTYAYTYTKYVLSFKQQSNLRKIPMGNNKIYTRTLYILSSVKWDPFGNNSSCRTPADN